MVMCIYAPNGVEEYTSLSFLDNITSVLGGIRINDDASLINPFTSLQYIGTDLWFVGIEGGQSAEIPNSITYLGNDFRISSSSDLIIEGMESLTLMDGTGDINYNEGELSIVNSQNIEFSALNNLEVLDEIYISDCSNIVLSGGLQSLVSVNKNFSFIDMEAGDSLTLPNSITSIGWNLKFINCDSLSVFGGLGLLNIGVEFRIDQCQDLIFSGLNNIEQLSKINLIESHSIDFTSGLQSLETVDGKIYFEECSGEFEFSGLENLKSIGGFRINDTSEELFINNLYPTDYGGEVIIAGDNNEAPINFSDTYMGDVVESVSINSVDNLSLSILTTVEAVNQGFALNNLSELYIGSNLIGLTEIGGSLSISNISLNGFTAGFQDLAFVGQELYLGDMPEMSNFGELGFPSLIYAGAVSLNNLGIQDLWLPFRNIEFVNSSFIVGNCPDLLMCTFPYICANLEDVEWWFGNTPQCNDYWEVSDGCIEPSILEGLVYGDFNCNGSQDVGEPGLPVGTILNEENLLGFTNSNGAYQIEVDQSEDYSITVGSLVGFENDTIYSFSPWGGNQTFTYDFPMCPSGGVISNLSVSITEVDPPMPGFTNQYQVCVANLGTGIESGSLSFEILDIESADIIEASGGVIDGSEVNWSVSGLEPFDSQCFTIVVQMQTGTLGQEFECIATIELDDGIDDDPSNNTHSIEPTVIGSYDPNDKLVNREIIDVSNDENDSLFTLEYMIRFQNTGTAPATFVRVLDNLPAKLDPASIEMLNASHEYELHVLNEDILEWFFDDINLPDSTSNEPESHGFIHFRIKTTDDIQPGLLIENNAHIFFDYNDPIITPYAITEFVECDEESVVIDAPTEVCAGDTVLLTAALPDFDTYTWTVEGEETNGGQQLQTAFNESGDVNLTITNETCTLSTSLEIEVKEQSALSVPLGPVITCDSTMNLEVSGNGSVNWFLQGSLVATGDPVSLSLGGIYTVTNENSCGIAENTIDVTVHRINLEEPELICENDPVVFEPNFEGYDTFNWVVGGEQYSGDSISVAFTGDGSVELQASSEFCADTTFLNFEVLPQPSMNILLEPYVGCFGEVQIDLDAVGLVNWWLDGGIINIGDPVTLQESGTYDVTVANDCNTIENVVSVEVYDIPEEVTLTFDGEQLVVSPEGSDYVWLLEGLPVSTEGPAFTPTESGDYTVIVYFESSICSQTSNMVFVPVSINEQLAQQIKIHPNPTRDFATIQLPQGEWTISLLNSKGQVLQVHERVISTLYNLDLQELSPAVYFVRVEAETRIAIKKLVVK